MWAGELRKRKALPRGCHRCEAQDHPGLPGVQAPQLHHQEEPAQRPGPDGTDEVLPELPLPPAAPRDTLAAVAVNTGYLGRTFPATEPYEVSRVKIADFAEAIGDRNPLYTDAAAAKAAGYPDVIAPPTFPIVITMAASRAAIGDPGLGINYAMVVHGDHRDRDQDRGRRTGLHRLRHPGRTGERMTKFADVTAGAELPAVSYPVNRLS